MDLGECPCVASRSPIGPGAPTTNMPTQPSPLHTHRPLHLMRQPSINPPSFYDDVAPPPLLTPPPNYDDLTPHVEVRNGYFDMDESSSNSDEPIDEDIADTLSTIAASIDEPDEE